MSPFTRARASMIEGQLRPNKVTNQLLLDTMGALPREQFVPDVARGIAYVDECIDLGGCRFMLEPMVLARLIQELAIKPTDIVLDIGTGTGYAAAVMARLAATVVAVEEATPLAFAATTNLQKTRSDNTVVITNKLAAGYAKQAPYDVILIEGGVTKIPDELLAQLAEGGRLAAVEIHKGPMGQAKLWQRTDGHVSSRVLFDAGVPLLPGFTPQPGFVF
jgi:protein-L-isoaspartate(D-aspartate) O-methyltransferase